MNTLHTVNKTGEPLALCLRSIADNDAILFIEEGVYCLLNSTNLSSHPVYALESDALARGVTLPDNTIPINYHQFVAITTKYKKIISWF